MIEVSVLLLAGLVAAASVLAGFVAGVVFTAWLQR